jgi:Protein of unknown function (DUF1115)
MAAVSAPGGPVLADLAAWMQAEGVDLLAASLGAGCPKSDQSLMLDGGSSSSAADGGFARYWIYSHHIYSRLKRRDLHQLAVEHRLTGFCHPGKPGVICVEVGPLYFSL